MEGGYPGPSRALRCPWRAFSPPACPAWPAAVRTRFLQAIEPCKPTLRELAFLSSSHEVRKSYRTSPKPPSESSRASPGVTRDRRQSGLGGRLAGQRVASPAALLRIQIERLRRLRSKEKGSGRGVRSLYRPSDSLRIVC